MLQELGFPQEQILIYEDNSICMAMAKNPQNHRRNRHIQVKYHCIREAIEGGLAKLEQIKTVDQLADIFTKGTHGPRLRDICSKLGLLVHDDLNQEESLSQFGFKHHDAHKDNNHCLVAHETFPSTQPNEPVS
jgi:hypothetical protein